MLLYSEELAADQCKITTFTVIEKTAAHEMFNRQQKASRVSPLQHMLEKFCAAIQ